jgi:hypothetical protein
MLREPISLRVYGVDPSKSETIFNFQTYTAVVSINISFILAIYITFVLDNRGG